MQEIRYPYLGATWLAAVREVYRAGLTITGETREVLGLYTTFEQGDFPQDPLLARFASLRHVEEMRKVFFSADTNLFGHSYHDGLRGPRGRCDLSDVVELLAAEPCSKRALLTLTGGNGRVPCINAVHFLRRNQGLQAVYFARGQDMFRKFYADALCIHEMGRRVASALDVPLLTVSGLTSSAHIYLADLPEIEKLLAEAATLPEQAVLHEEKA
jgi:thymidylate synthase